MIHFEKYLQGKREGEQADHVPEYLRPFGILVLSGMAASFLFLCHREIFRPDIANPVAETFTLLLFSMAFFFYIRGNEGLAVNMIFGLPVAIYLFYLSEFSHSDPPGETIWFTIIWLIVGLMVLTIVRAGYTKLFLFFIAGNLILLFHAKAADLLNLFFSQDQILIKNHFLIFLFAFAFVFIIGKTYDGQMKRILEEKNDLEQNLRDVFQQIRHPLAQIRALYDTDGNITRIVVEKINNSFESEFRITLHEAKNQELNYLFSFIFRNDTHWNDLLIIHPVTQTEIYVPGLEQWYNLHFLWINKFYCYCLFYNITPGKKSLKWLEETRSRYLALLEAIPDLFFIIDQDGIFQDVVFKGQEKFNLEVSELVGNNLFNVGFSKLMADKIFECIHKTIENDTIESIEYSMETKGSSLFFEMRLAKLDEVSVIAISRDITRRKKAEFELEIAKNKAEEAIALKSRFLANLSHDIRTPVNIMVGLSKLLAEPVLTDEQKADFIHDVQLQGNLLLQMIENTIQLSKIETDTLELNFSYTNIHRLLQELFDTYYQLLPENRDLQLIIHTVIKHEEVGFETEPTLLKEVFSRLLDNSLKFTRQGIIRFGYEVDKSNHVLFFVEDTGPGIPESEKENIFLRFYVIDSDRKDQKTGPGLGLPIAQHFVALLGGELELTSVPGQGSRFWFRLPLRNSKGFLKVIH